MSTSKTSSWKSTVLFFVFFVAITLVSAKHPSHRPTTFSVPLVHSFVKNLKAIDITTQDKARIRSYQGQSRLSKRRSSVSITNIVSSYTVRAKVGNQQFSLIVDTGSSSIFVGARHRRPYVPSLTSHNLKTKAQLNYVEGYVSGDEYTDKVSIGSVALKKMMITAVDDQEGFSDIDGILGFGPQALTMGTVTGYDSIPTFMQTAMKQKQINANILGLYCKSSLSLSSKNGALTFGGVDQSKFNGTITYGNLTTTYPSSQFWGISVSFAAGYRNLGSATGIVDSGTTLIYLPSDVTAAFYKTTKFKYDSTTEFYRSTTTAGMQNLTVIFNGTPFTIKAKDLLVPKFFVQAAGFDTNYVYSWVGSNGSTGTGLDFTLGQKFLEHFYSVYDTDNARLGLAIAT